MATASTEPLGPARFVLRYESLAASERAFAFPCDAQGHVDIDALSDRARQNYLYVRAMVGRDFLVPDVLRTEEPEASCG